MLTSSPRMLVVVSVMFSSLLLSGCPTIAHIHISRIMIINVYMSFLLQKGNPQTSHCSFHAKIVIEKIVSKTLLPSVCVGPFHCVSFWPGGTSWIWHALHPHWGYSEQHYSHHTLPVHQPTENSLSAVLLHMKETNQESWWQASLLSLWGLTGIIQ